MTQKKIKAKAPKRRDTNSSFATKAFMEKRSAIISLLCAEEKTKAKNRINPVKPVKVFLDKRKSVIDALSIEVNGVVVKPVRPMGPVVSGLRRSSLVEYTPRGPKSGGTMAYTKIVSGFGNIR